MKYEVTENAVCGREIRHLISPDHRSAARTRGALGRCELGAHVIGAGMPAGSDLHCRAREETEISWDRSHDIGVRFPDRVTPRKLNSRSPSR
jgi:hypothetical protein